MCALSDARSLSWPRRIGERHGGEHAYDAHAIVRAAEEEEGSIARMWCVQKSDDRPCRAASSLVAR